MINYKLTERKNPMNEGEPSKFYGTVICTGKMDINKMAENISKSCTVTRADCLAVLAAMQEEIIFALQNGMRVHLGDIGCFRITARGKGAETKETFNIRMIEKLNVVFTANTTLKESLKVDKKEIQFYNMEKNQEEETAGEDTTGGGTDEGSGN